MNRHIYSILLFLVLYSMSYGQVIKFNSTELDLINFSIDSLKKNYSKNKVPISKLERKIDSCLRSQATDLNCIEEIVNLINTCLVYDEAKGNLMLLELKRKFKDKISNSIIDPPINPPVDTSIIIPPVLPIVPPENSWFSYWTSKLLLALLILIIIVTYILFRHLSKANNKLDSAKQEIKKIYSVLATSHYGNIPDLEKDSVVRNLSTIAKTIKEHIGLYNKQLAFLKDENFSLKQKNENWDKLTDKDKITEVKDKEKNENELKIPEPVFQPSEFYLNYPVADASGAFFENIEENPEISIKAFYKIRTTSSTSGTFELNPQRLDSIKTNPKLYIESACDYQGLSQLTKEIDLSRSKSGSIILDGDVWRIKTKAKVIFK